MQHTLSEVEHKLDELIKAYLALQQKFNSLEQQFFQTQHALERVLDHMKLAAEETL